MKMLLMALLAAAVLSGCRTPLTPEQSWSDYGRYYKSVSVAQQDPVESLEIMTVRSANLQSTVEGLKLQGRVVLGHFTIDDGTEISQRAVMALAQYLKADRVVWSTISTSPAYQSALPNPDLGIIGDDLVQRARNNVMRPDESFSDHTLHCHEIWMLAKGNAEVNK